MHYVERLDNVRIINSFLKILNKDYTRDFWSSNVVSEIRQMAVTGRPIRIFRRGARIYRILDRLSFGKDEVVLKGDETYNSDLTSYISDIELAAPIYIGDMSFGSLSGVPNVVVAEAADELNLVAGTGEGGLHPDVAKHRRIFVQWASARFGVDIDVLMRGLGIVIKIGQGAKPGIGGHLPGSKVTGPISMVRRIPIGVDALSPAPHHDIYSIEDLKQRIDALKEATGKPVLVKIAATNYAPYIAVGIARMGADGVIIDGHGAGTGAAPHVVKDNVGIPIELAVASVDKMLRREGLRDGFTVVASGRVSSADDAAKIMALGADVVALGTSILNSMGCIMARTCHTGNCPAGITSRLADGSVLVDHDLAKRAVINYLKAFQAELGLILDNLGLRSVRELVGRRDLLRGYCINNELTKILDVEGDCPSELPLKNSGSVWTPDYSIYASQLAKKGDVVISSMGSTGPPEVEPPKRLIDWLRLDGAQVTKPSIDPYREDIDMSVYLAGGRLQMSAPLIIRPLTGWGLEQIEKAKFVAHLMDLAIDLYGFDNPSSRHSSRIMWNKWTSGIGAIVLSLSDLHGMKAVYEYDSPIYIRLPPLLNPIKPIEPYLNQVSGIIIDDALSGEVDLEVSVVNADLELRRRGIRYGMDVIAHMTSLRSSGDAVKLAALGADAVEVSSIIGKAVTIDGFEDKLINIINGLRREMAQLLGAAGVYTYYSTIVGNRELLRALDPRVKELLKVKVAGEW
ncbi:FMN-binding glutamate synthase family protein [Caldivirga sp. UBA161]|uniref:FMN-binding glutamate synthase family protein n=1 Tax=Caldivirga sp. UBA161 TaxID=1915569 RepID=UPI0025C2BA16|nr:glutamate synthase-related protein [Caldivirga sp. UBA161]